QVTLRGWATAREAGGGAFVLPAARMASEKKPRGRTGLATNGRLKTPRLDERAIAGPRCPAERSDISLSIVATAAAPPNPETPHEPFRIAPTDAGPYVRSAGLFVGGYGSTSRLPPVAFQNTT